MSYYKIKILVMHIKMLMLFQGNGFSGVSDPNNKWWSTEQLHQTSLVESLCIFVYNLSKFQEVFGCHLGTPKLFWDFSYDF